MTLPHRPGLEREASDHPITVPPADPVLSHTVHNLEPGPAARERAWLRWLRRVGWLLVGLYFLAALALLAARYWLVPQLPEYRERIAQAASKALGQRITIDALSADWRGFHPWIELRGVTVYDREDNPALTLPRVHAVFAWRSIPARELRLRSLVVERADLDIRRSADGRLYVAGMELTPSPDSAGNAADWVLRQGEIHIRDGSIEWLDELRGAPPLRFDGLNLLLRNGLSRHEFAFRGAPPAEYGQAVDIRGQFDGRSFARWQEWSGRLYAAVDDIDLDAWRQWVDYPFDLGGGRGALRLWLSVGERGVHEVRAQVALADVRLRARADLPELQLAALQGELGGRQSRDTLALLGWSTNAAYEIYGRELRLQTRDGERLQPGDFTVRWALDEAGNLARGEITAAKIELEPLSRLSGYFVLPEDFRRLVEAAAPQGTLHQVEFAWRGALEAPAGYSARARFEGLGMAAHGDLPGFQRLDGEVQLSETGGRLKAEARDLALHYPGVFAVDRFALERMSTRINWNVREGAVDVRVEELLFENADASGSLSGRVRTTASGSQWLDLTGRATRAHGPAVYKYIPYLPPEVAQWLRESILAGRGSDVRFRLRGDLADFPFRDPRKGEFRIAANLADVHLRYAADWPAIEHLSGEMLFDGPSLTILAQRATTLGAQLQSVEARFDDLYHDAPVLRVTGRAQAPTEALLHYIAKSPVRGYINGLTDGWTAEGPGRLELALVLPLEALERSRVQGRVVFDDNTIVMAPGDLPMTHVKGHVDFSERGASSPGIQAQYAGGPLTVRIEQDGDAILTRASGRGEAAALARSVGVPFAERLKGMLQYQAVLRSEGGRTHSVFESDLRGVAIELPAPLAKAAAESWPLRIERASESAARQRLSVSLGEVFNLQGVLRREGARTVLERAGVAIGSAAVPRPAGAAIAVAVEVPRVDLDAFAPLLQGGAGGATMAPVASLDLRTKELVGVGRVVHDVIVRAQLRDKVWRAEVQARELAGEVSWLPKGNGVVKARLRYLHQPQPVAEQGGEPPERQSLPALDIVAERFVLDGRELGRLELQAFNERGGWRIDHVALATAAGTASASGYWRPARLGQERTDLNIKVQVQNIGAYLKQFGYEDTVRGGEGELSGQVGWNGPPTALDYGSLSGTLQLRAENGQFVQIKPGMGRLLGVLSLQALPRRIALDFKDVFGEGFAFDRIDGTATITRGVIRTDNLGMVGPSATVAITGTADLARETQNLHVRVVPTVGDSVATAAGLALLNPVVGVGAWIAQRILKDPIGQMFAYEYAITGSWHDPKVQKLRAPDEEGNAP